MLQREVANGRNDVVADEEGGARNAQRSAQRSRCVAELGLGDRDLAQCRAYASMKGEACFGGPRRACSAADEDDAELRFERRERPADRLQRPTKASGRPSQIPGFNDRDEGLVVLE